MNIGKLSVAEFENMVEAQFGLRVVVVTPRGTPAKDDRLVADVVTSWKPRKRGKK